MATKAIVPEDGIYDVGIVGGGPAGLSAALWLGRYLHSVVLIDSGEPRNWETRGINGFLGSQGIKSPDLRAKGRADAHEYGVTFVEGEICTVNNTNGEHFVLITSDKVRYECSRLLLAIGIKDVWPRIPGLGECYGETAHVCPDCDGYDTRDCKTVVIGSGRRAVGMA
ncbi:MAG: NAD(P)/FAD-dependent oxidoreductase, partial [Gemmatimonadaceae bacterium]